MIFVGATDSIARARNKIGIKVRIYLVVFFFCVSSDRGYRLNGVKPIVWADSGT
jgi:hypothetical protein